MKNEMLINRGENKKKVSKVNVRKYKKVNKVEHRNIERKMLKIVIEKY